MASTAPTTVPGRGVPATHPGQVLKDLVLPGLREQGVPTTEVVRRLGIGRQTLYDVLEERRPVTPELALRLARLLGNSPQFWLNMQQAWDLDRARAELGDRLDAIERIKGAPRP